eukprot:TRINITY_DN2776_c2_g1_i2.p1 TRINITY_DN2776_c2_g1~~TRINITY_DN2776_c2_g1_i2.p1  ORF type:complete len:178 (-),score=36.62 TRINITY_DN2776_c2_g1_i2:233-766(-)
MRSRRKPAIVRGPYKFLRYFKLFCFILTFAIEIYFFCYASFITYDNNYILSKLNHCNLRDSLWLTNITLFLAIFTVLFEMKFSPRKAIHVIIFIISTIVTLIICFFDYFYLTEECKIELSEKAPSAVNYFSKLFYYCWLIEKIVIICFIIAVIALIIALLVIIFKFLKRQILRLRNR